MSEYSKCVTELVDWYETFYKKIDREEYFEDELKQIDECFQNLLKNLRDVTDKIKVITDKDLENSTPKSLKALREDLAAWKNLGFKNEPSPEDYVKKIDAIFEKHTTFDFDCL